MSLNDILVVVNSVAIINIVIVCLFLCFRKNNLLPNYILAVIFCIPGLYFVDNILILTNSIYKYYYWFFIVQILATGFPIAAYYYVHLLLADKKRFHKLLISGSIILFIYIVFLSISFYTLPPNEKTNYISTLNTSDNYPTSMLLYSVFFYAWQMTYLVVLTIEIRKYIKNAEHSFSSFDALKIEYIKKFIQLLGILNLLLVICYIILPLPTVDYGILPTVVTIIYLFIILYTIKYNAVFSRESYSILEKESSTIIDFEAEQASISQSDFEDLDSKLKSIGLKIETALIENKGYQNPNFKLALLAEKVNEQPYLVSQALNKYFKKSFFELINELRVKEAELRLKDFDSKKDKIETIAYEVGFNSRASFYRSFKKITGKNPSELVSLS